MESSYKLMYTGFIVVLFSLEGIQSNEEGTCAPSATKIFPWNYTTATTFYRKYWSHRTNGEDFKNILYIYNGDSSATPVAGTPFDGRVREYPESNAGLIVSALETFDTGIFRVQIQFLGPPEEIYEEKLTVSPDSAIVEIIRNARIKIQSSTLAGVYNASDITELGAPPIEFDFYVDGACIPTPAITIYFNEVSSHCPDSFTCGATFEEEGEMYVTVSTSTHKHRFPGTDALYKVTEETPTTAMDSGAADVVLNLYSTPLVALLFILILNGNWCH